MMIRERQYISIGKVTKTAELGICNNQAMGKTGKINCCFRTIKQMAVNIIKIREQFLK